MSPIIHLSRSVLQYLLIVPIFAFIIIAPCMSQSRWGAAFEPPQQHRYIAPPWYSAIRLSLVSVALNYLSRYSLFQVISAFTNTGTSLVDQSMVPFQKAYSQIVYSISHVSLDVCNQMIF